MAKLWDVPGEVKEVFYAAADYAVAIGTTLTEDQPAQSGTKFVGVVDTQLTNKGALTKDGEQYCKDYGVSESADGLMRWAVSQMSRQKAPAVKI